MSFWSRGFAWTPRKTVAQRRAEAEREIENAARRGKATSPVAVSGRKLATTFWGKAWCDNLERYRDFAYRLERGRSYLRSGSVLDLQIAAGKISSEVLGSQRYEVAIEIDAVKRDAWRALQRDCAGSVGSRLDLLSGRLSEAVMARLCADRTGLFPAPSAIRFTCSCPDHATMCKHVAAAMYGVGVRLDRAPEMLFTLRRVSLDELLASAVTAVPAAPAAGRVLATGGLASLFGIELVDTAAAAAPPDAAPSTPKAKPQRRRGAAITRSAGRVAPRAGKRAASSKPAAPSKRAVPSKAATARKRAAPSKAATPSKPRANR